MTFCKLKLNYDIEASVKFNTAVFYLFTHVLLCVSAVSAVDRCLSVRLCQNGFTYRWNIFTLDNPNIHVFCKWL